MSKIDELIKKYCPDGVEYKTLGELGKFYGGLTGKSKDDFNDGNAIFITYKNVYSNPSLDLHPLEKVKIAPGEKQRTLEYGDIIFTGSSETPDECGFSSVVTEVPDEPLYLNSFCFIFRLNDVGILNPDFSKHLFRSSDLRYQIGKTASGVTRYNVSKKLMEKVSIPVPPLEVQSEIVRVLDSFTLLTAELTAELTARQKQYEFYRDELLTFDDTVEMVTLQDICKKICSGGTPKSTNKDYYGGDIPWLRTQEVDWDDIYDTGVKITQEGLDNSSAKWIPKDCLIIAMYGATAAKAAINRIPLTTNQACCNLEINSEVADLKYVFHWMSKEYINLKEMGQGSQSNINAGIVRNYPIPLPSLAEQKRIANILDKLYALVKNMDSGIPAEIQARNSQYNYYRSKLLTFKKKVV